MLQIRGLSKSYGTRPLLDNISFSLKPRERLGLIGRNGSGKSTLFRIITGEEICDSGSVIIPRGYRIGHLEQHLRFTEPTILEEVCLGLPIEERDQEYRGAIILAGLGFSEADNKRAASEFSGGFQIRLNLAKLLLSEPNLLLLDEPTNYLDIVTMRWLTNFLRSWRGELILISHDRSFMDSVTTDTCLIHRNSIIKQPGDTQKLYERIALEEEIYERTRVNEDKKRREVEQFINRFRAKASKAALVQSKVKELARMEQKEALQDEQSLDFRFCEAAYVSKMMIEVKKIAFNYPQSSDLIRDLSFTVGKLDRIGIIGKNGKGKSTLLKLLAEELAPSNGEIRVSSNVRMGYFGQTNVQKLSPNLSIEEEISSANPELHRTKVRAICGTMMFSGDDGLKKVSVLSGGEKSRVLLGKILAQPTNLLLLDEPTNHLDMESIDALIDSLECYQGAVIIVTHSERILRKIATRLVVFQDQGPQLVEHDYDYFLDTYGWNDEVEAPSRMDGKTKKNQVSATTGTTATISASTLEWKLAAKEKKISKLESEIKDLEGEITLAAEKLDLNHLEELTLKLSEVQAAIDQEYEELAKIVE